MLAWNRPALSTPNSGRRSCTDRLRTDWSTLSAEARQIASKAFETIDQPDLRSVLLRSAELDATTALLRGHSAVGGRDLVAIYLPGLDIAQHALAAADSTPTASALQARAAAIRHYHFFVGDLIRRYADLDRALVIVVTHPGRVSSAARAAIAVYGRVGARGIAGAPATIADVAPTVLYALGLPAARDLSGRPLTELFNEVFVERHPVRMVDTYGQPSAARAERGGHRSIRRRSNGSGVSATCGRYRRA